MDLLKTLLRVNHVINPLNPTLSTFKIDPRRPFEKPLYFVIDLTEFCTDLVHSLVPDFNDGFCTASLIYWFQQLIQHMNATNIFFIFFSHSQTLSRFPVESEPDELLLANTGYLEVLLVWVAMENNRRCMSLLSPAFNQLHFVKNESQIAHWLESLDVYCAFSFNPNFCFSKNCKLVFLPSHTDWKSFCSRMHQNKRVSFTVFELPKLLDQLSLSHENFLIFLEICADPTCKLLSDFVSDGSKDSIKLQELLNQCRDDRFRTHWELLINDRCFVELIQKVSKSVLIFNNLNIISSSNEPFTNPGHLLDYVQLKLHAFHSLNSIRDLSLTTQKAKHDCFSLFDHTLRAILHVKSEDLLDQESCQLITGIKLVQLQDVVVTGGLPCLEVLLTIVEMLSKEISMIVIVNPPSLGDDTLFFVFLLVRFLNQRRLFLEGVESEHNFISLVDVVLISFTFAFHLSNCSFVNSNVASRSSYLKSQFLYLSIQRFSDLFACLNYHSFFKIIAVTNTRLFVFLLELVVLFPDELNCDTNNPDDVYNFLSSQFADFPDCIELCRLLVEFASLNTLSEFSLSLNRQRSIISSNTKFTSNCKLFLDGNTRKEFAIDSILYKNIQQSIATRCHDIVISSTALQHEGLRCFEKLDTWNKSDDYFQAQTMSCVYDLLSAPVVLKIADLYLCGIGILKSWKYSKKSHEIRGKLEQHIQYRDDINTDMGGIILDPDNRFVERYTY
ncbi:hypothetical protein GEMRC1_001787 [Eukaryota sp. GEM-RC1]